MWLYDSTIKMYQDIAAYKTSLEEYRDNYKYDKHGEFLKLKLKAQRNLKESIKQAIKEHSGEENDELAMNIYSIIKEKEEQWWDNIRYARDFHDSPFLAYVIPFIDKEVNKVYDPSEY